MGSNHPTDLFHENQLNRKGANGYLSEGENKMTLDSATLPWAAKIRLKNEWMSALKFSNWTTK